MSIRVECPACRSGFNVRDDFAGKRGKCPQCKTPIDVPAARAEPALSRRVAEPEVRAEEAEESGTYMLADSAPKVRAVPIRGGKAVEGVLAHAAKVVEPTRPSQTPVRILAAFRGEIRPVRATLLYRLWIVIVAGMMVLLPVVYVAIIGLVGLALGLHATRGVVVFENVRNIRAALALYATPLAAGGVVIAFMIKPLFARPAKRGKTRALDPSKEPLVFAFVDGVCSSVGAPTPSRIEVDCQVNASAHRASGPFSVFNNDLVLTIGLPLVAGMTLKQFAGVLAHEFGHFSQGAGMRLSNLIWMINAWFARVVHERDEWDETLAAWSTDGNIYVMVVAWLARLAVWLTRRILWALMLVGHAVSGFLSRQMEFDADRYEARMVGGAVFAETMTRLGELNLAAQGAYADLASSWNERRLPDDLPKLILANVPQVPEPIRELFRQAEEDRRTGLFDTHPAPRDRISRARAEASEGIFRLDGPATDLFPYFDSLSRSATFDHYRALLGPEISKDQLYPVTDVIQGQAVAQQGHEAFDRFFLGGFGPMQPLPLPTEYPAAPDDLKAAKRALIEARTGMERAREGRDAALARWDEREFQSIRSDAAVILLKAGNKIKPADYGLASGTLNAAETAGFQAASGFREVTSALQPFEAAAVRRMTLALALLESDPVANRVADGPARRDEARALLGCAAFLGGRIVGELPPVVRAQQVLSQLCQMFTQGKDDKNEPLINACLRAAREVRDRLQELQWKLGNTVLYPFEHAHEGISLGRFALPNVPQADALGELLQVSGEALDKLTTLYFYSSSNSAVFLITSRHRELNTRRPAGSSHQHLMSGGSLHDTGRRARRGRAIGRLPRAVRPALRQGAGPGPRL